MQKTLPWHDIVMIWWWFPASPSTVIGGDGTCPGARPTNDISFQFQIQGNYAMITYSADHNEILHTSQQ